MTRAFRTQIAHDTLAACEVGYYDLANGTRVAFGDALADARAGTALHAIRDRLDPGEPRAAQTIEVTEESTIEACRRLDVFGHDRHVGALNFASAKHPGGGFLGGAQAQEEALARSSGLYPCLLEQPEHYARNEANRSVLYLDLAIVSPLVPIFRHDDGAWLDTVVRASIITCAAPNAGAARGRAEQPDVEAVLRRRARFVLQLAAHYQITHLVLGAWGCGVFKNDPVLVADAFAIAELAWFPHVTFAIYGGGANLDAFRARFPV